MRNFYEAAERTAAGAAAEQLSNAAEENSSLRSRVIAAELSLQQEQRESGRRASRASAESRAQLEYLEEKLRKK